jgi:hypothetical protein
MTVAFGDADPEDAWDPDDPLPVLADNLRRRAVILAAAAGLSAMVRHRLELLAEDLEHVAGRIAEGLD